jgi:hydrogenase maturation protease
VSPGGRIVIIGLGNEFRRDDGAGLAVLGLLRTRPLRDVELLASDGEPAGLLTSWTGAELAIVVDAMTGSPPSPGRLHRITGLAPGTGVSQAASSHGLGLREAIGLGEVLERRPARLILHGVEAADLALGTGLSPPVAASMGRLAEAVLRDVPAARGGLGGATGTGP